MELVKDHWNVDASLAGPDYCVKRVSDLFNNIHSCSQDYFPFAQPSAQQDVARNTVDVVGLIPAGVVSVGEVKIVPNACHIQDVYTDPAKDHGNVDANLAGPVIFATRN